MDKNKLVFEKMNYILLVSGIVILMIGLYVMTLDKEAYGEGSLGITIGPVIVLLGLVVEFFAIFYKSKKQ
jgi:hypothetical protein